MYEQVEKPKKNKSRGVASSIGQRKSAEKQGFGFVDNRPEAIAQRKLKEMANNTPQVSQLRAFQGMTTNNSPLAKLVVQFQTGASADPITRIKNAVLSEEFMIPIGNSRAKVVYLFKGNGDPTKNKAEAHFMIDTEMNEIEYGHLKAMERHGLRIPTIYGRHTDGPIVQWLSDQSTVGGGGAKPLLPIVRQIMRLDVINGKGFVKSRWDQALLDVTQLIDLKFTSPDLQFMIDNASGHVYLMDFDNANIPSLGKEADQRLIDLKAYLKEAIAIGSAPELPASAPSPFGRGAPGRGAPGRRPFGRGALGRGAPGRRPLGKPPSGK